MATSDQVGSEEAAQMVEPEVRENSLRSGTENKTDISPANDLHSHRNDPVKQAENSESQIDADPESLEEGELTWESCTCSNASCLSCRAEKVAIMTWSKPSDTQRVSQCTEGYPRGSLQRSVFFKNYCTCGYKIYYFHSSVSDTTLDGRECAASPCALAVLLFAKTFVKEPSEFTGTDVPDMVFNQVVSAIGDGIQLYQDRYGSEPKSLTPQEACIALPDFAAVQEEFVTNFDQELFAYLVHQLEPNEALLIYCEIPYFVVSVMNSKTKDNVVVFGSRKGPWEYETPYKGCHIVSCKKRLNH